MDQKHIVTRCDPFPLPRARNPLLPPVKNSISKAPHHNNDNISSSHLNHQPVASGSHVRSDAEFDNSDLMEPDTDEEQLEIPLDLWGDGVGIQDSPFDADGDFYGKGKDLFVGPTADIGEYVAKISE